MKVDAPTTVGCAAESPVDPVDWWRRVSGDAKDANRPWCVPGWHAPAKAEWSVDPCRLPCGAWRNCGAACAVRFFSGCQHEQRLLGTRAKPSCRRWAVPGHDGRRCWEIENASVFSSANTRARLATTCHSKEHRGRGLLCLGECE